VVLDIESDCPKSAPITPTVGTTTTPNPQARLSNIPAAEEFELDAHKSYILRIT